jgi:hypothetical protein
MNDIFAMTSCGVFDSAKLATLRPNGFISARESAKK